MNPSKKRLQQKNKQSIIEKYLLEHRPTKCPICEGRIYYHGLGKYECKHCDEIIYDDYGKVREYVDAHENCTISDVRRATGVEEGVIELFLKVGKFEIPDGGNFYLACHKCGCALKFGTFCSECIRGISGELSEMLAKEGERPKRVLKGKIHFLGTLDED